MHLDAIDGLAPMRRLRCIGGRTSEPTGGPGPRPAPRFSLKPIRCGVQYARIRPGSIGGTDGTGVRVSELLIRGWRSMDLSIHVLASHTARAQLEISAFVKKYLTNPAEHALGSHRSCMGQRQTNPSNGATDA